MFSYRVFAMSAAICVLCLGADKDANWPVYGHDPGGQKYSPLAGINRQNVKQLKIAWTFHTGDVYKAEHHKQSAFECTPLFVDGTLYVTTPFGRVIALDPETGKPRWSYDPKIQIDAGYGDFANRGASTWVDSKTHKRRIYIATIDAQLIALDAATGKPIPGFGDEGRVDLRKGLRNPPAWKSEYEETSPPAVIGDLLIVGSGVADNNRVNEASGEVRAFDARTGKLRWTWDPMPGQRTGAANAWSIISVDPRRGLVFIPTGSASPDYFGGERPGNDLYADSLVVLHAATGKMAWSFQTVHHDLWDYDVASQPMLFTMKRNGREIAAVAVGSKTGHLFIFERETGKPLFPIEERRVPASDVSGEQASPTQPVPVMPKPLVPQTLNAETAWGATSADRQWCQDTIRGLRADGMFTPPSIKGSLLFPGNIGGMAWGGATFDPPHGLIVIPTNRLAAVARLIPRPEFEKEAKQPHGDWEFAEQKGTPYGMARRFLRNPHGLPCNPPPWGTLVALDAATGVVKWEVPFGVFPGASASDKLGSVNLGGAIATGGGLIFIGATLDAHLHAFDVLTGKELWQGELPAGARATPMTYRAANGKQYVVIASGGFDVPGLPLSDTLVAFALP